MRTVSPITVTSWIMHDRRQEFIKTCEHNAWFDSLGPRFMRCFWLSLRLGKRVTVKYIGPRDTVVLCDGRIISGDPTDEEI